jgi:hypothetical protein
MPAAFIRADFSDDWTGCNMPEAEWCDLSVTVNIVIAIVMR